jgi:hypothetical protein
MSDSPSKSLKPASRQAFPLMDHYVGRARSTTNVITSCCSARAAKPSAARMICAIMSRGHKYLHSLMASIRLASPHSSWFP